METRCPVPLQGPRSPLGYQVIEIEDEQAPPSRACLQSSREHAERETPRPTRAPWAAVGCQVVEVGEKWSPGVPPSTEPAVLAPKRRPVRQVQPLFLCGALVAGVFFLPALALGLLIVHLPTGSRTVPTDRTLAQKSGRTTAIAKAPQEAVAGDAGLGGPMAAEGGMPGPVAGLPGSGCQPRGLYRIQLPESDPAQAPDKDLTEALPPVAKEACQAGEAERETFGTAVQFVRNPQEAARIAGAERMLTFLLHVSGNFEDDRFT